MAATRKESSYSYTDENGARVTVRALDHITPDDVMSAMMRLAAYEVANGVEYRSPLSPEVTDYLIRARVTAGG